MATVTLHYIYPSEDGKIKSAPVLGSDGKTFSNGGSYSLACAPEQAVLTPSIRATDAAVIVNCDKCKSSAIFIEHLAHPCKKQGGLESTLRGY